jgi:hypothetical protein
MTPGGVVHDQTGTQWISWRSTRQRVWARGVHCRIVCSCLRRLQHGAAITFRGLLESAYLPLAEVQLRVGAEVVPGMAPGGVVHGPSRTQWISWRNARQRVGAQGVPTGGDRGMVP